MPGNKGKETKDKRGRASTPITNYTVSMKDGKRTSSVLSPMEQEAQKKKSNLYEPDTSTLDMDDTSTDGNDVTLLNTEGLDQDERLDVSVTTHAETKMAEHNVVF